MSGRPGIVLIGTATALAGMAAYLITWLVPRSIGFAGYAVFAVFWAFMFLVVAALSGIQQEVTRGTRARAEAQDGPNAVWRFGALAALGVFAAVSASAVLWVGAVFPHEGWPLVWPLAVGASSYVFVAIISGTLYGITHWSGLFWIVALEGLLRLVAIAITLLVTTEIVALAWAVVLPFPVTVLLMLPLARRALVGRTWLDVGPLRLGWNVSRTMIAAASMGLLISGFPLLLGLSARAESQRLVGMIILASTLVRAPLIVTAMAFQSYLIVLFRNHAQHFWRIFLGLQALVMALGLVLAVVGFAIGPWVFGLLFPREPVPDGWFIAVLVASSALVGALCISAPAVLARAQHLWFAAGWVAAALVTVGGLLLPIDLTTRTLIALTAGPLAGLLVHGTHLALARRAGAEFAGTATSATVDGVL